MAAEQRGWGGCSSCFRCSFCYSNRVIPNLQEQSDGCFGHRREQKFIERNAFYRWHPGLKPRVINHARLKAGLLPIYWDGWSTAKRGYFLHGNYFSLLKSNARAIDQQPGFPRPFRARDRYRAPASRGQALLKDRSPVPSIARDQLRANMRKLSSGIRRAVARRSSARMTTIKKLPTILLSACGEIFPEATRPIDRDPNPPSFH